MRFHIIDGAGRPCGLYAETLTEEEYSSGWQELDRRLPLLRISEKVRHCKADIFEGSVHGTIYVPARNNMFFGGDENAGGSYTRFYMDKEKLLFIGGQQWTEKVLKQIFSEDAFRMTTTAQALFAFLDSLIYDEGEHVDEKEESLNRWESRMLEKTDEIPEGFDHYMQKTRRELLADYRYYDQLGDMAQMLAETPCEEIDKRAARLFRFLSDRLDRLAADALNLREYSSQIYDMYQSRISVRQNKIIQFLTVITTIFMPLTLITGWYGMNFSAMPEIRWEYGYLAVIGLSVGLLIIEYIIFKRKKWM